jgi:hypothetical protein
MKLSASINSATQSGENRNSSQVDAASSVESSRHGVAVSDINYTALADGSVGSKRCARSHRFHWGETAAIVVTAAGLALVVSHILPNATSSRAAAAFRVIEAKGSVLCERNDGSHWLPCDFDRSASVVGFRTTPAASLTLETTIGARMEFAPGSTLLMADANGSGDARRVTIPEGRFDFTVPNLGAQLPFSIVTPDLSIALQGSQANVEVKRENGRSSGRTSTCVRLQRGAATIVVDGRELRVAAPATWGCRPS